MFSPPEPRSDQVAKLGVGAADLLGERSRGLADFLQLLFRLAPDEAQVALELAPVLLGRREQVARVLPCQVELNAQLVTQRLQRLDFFLQLFVAYVGHRVS